MTLPPSPHRVADARPDNWASRWTPPALLPYVQIARWDRPIGAWLLFWPCAWGAGLAAVAARTGLPNFSDVVLFLAGAFAMRGAGCTWNDIVDRDIDGRVARTASRPLPSGRLTLAAAFAFLAAQLLVGLVILLQFNDFAVVVGLCAVLPIAIYPFMKRITWWPQAMLGICFSWGALMGWAAHLAGLGFAALLLYAGSIAWVIAYDTIYALQDIEDDALVGVHSTARLFGPRVRQGVLLFYGLAVAILAAALVVAGAGWAGWLGLAAFAAVLAWEIATLDPADPARCLALFKANSPAALVLFAGLTLDCAVRALG
jgi:4-hydroxybenzoate polyprenyltransferase